METGDRADEGLLLDVLSDFAHTLAGRFDVSEVLYRLAENVVGILDVAGAGVSVVDDQGRLRPVTTINELTARLESVEEATQEGPCVDSFQNGTVIRVDRLSDEEHRWPAWCAQAKCHGVEAVLGIPLRGGDEVIGAMNIYNVGPRQWRDSDVRVAQLLADMAAGYVANASDLERSRRTTEQLTEALDSRIVIEQAKGMLAAEYRISVDQAFTLLRNHARGHGASLKGVAEAVVNLGLRPPARPPS
ncbi:MAG TPA: GAF and ANTAR domain-containing protein [Acidimicrobiia bacterium]|nr:GAF and ANTAR domain-containing protein [Acidimicrobiia bacterium]